MHEHDDDRPCGCSERATAAALAGALPANVVRDLETIAGAISLKQDPGVDELAKILREPQNVAVRPADRITCRTAVLWPELLTASGNPTDWQPLVQPSPDLLATTITVPPSPISGGGGGSAFAIYITADPGLQIPRYTGTSDLAGIAMMIATTNTAAQPLRIVSRSGLWVAAECLFWSPGGTASPVVVAGVAEYRD